MIDGLDPEQRKIVRGRLRANIDDLQSKPMHNADRDYVYTVKAILDSPDAEQH
jgi:hypothetical protein